MNKKVKCPTCGTMIHWSKEQKFKPFCSERCKLIDLGEWITEKNTIPGESVSVDDDANPYE